MTDRETEWAALMRAANAGDARAYARFLSSATPVLRGIVRARARTQGPDVHEDILQEVLMALHVKRHTWDPTAPLLPWLWAVTRYKVIDAYRRQGSTVQVPIEDMADELEAPATDPTAARDSAALLARLDARSAEIVRAVSLDGETAAEVGARLAMNEGAVRVALHRAMGRLARFAKGDQA